MMINSMARLADILPAGSQLRAEYTACGSLDLDMHICIYARLHRSVRVRTTGPCAADRV